MRLPQILLFFLLSIFLNSPVYGADTWDVARCTALAEATAVFVWNGKGALAALGKGATWANTSLQALVGSKEAALGLQLILGAFGIKALPDDWLKWSVAGFYKTLIQPAWKSCQDIGMEFASLPETIQTLISVPQFHKPKPNDGPGVRNGRFCAGKSLNVFGGTWLSGGYDKCRTCCENLLTADKGLSRHLSGCRAVCHAQFD